jgi:predicted permease
MVLCVVLLSGAGLLIRSLVHVYDAPLGVDPKNVLTMQINLPEAKYPRSADQISFYSRLKPRLEALPGVEGVANTTALPASGSGMANYPFEIEGIPGEPKRGRGAVVSADYFRVMRANPLRGRVFQDSNQPEIVVNQSFANRFWPHEDALGKHLRVVRGREPAPWMTVVGIVPNVLHDISQPAENSPMFYLSSTREPRRQVYIAARTSVPPETLGDVFRREVQALDPDLAVFNILTLEERVSQSRGNVAIISMFFSIFAAIAFVLGSVGLYAVMSHSVSRRTREIGVRLALGGARRHILTMVFRQGMGQVALGLAIGIPAALAVTRVLRSALVGVEPGDPATLASVILLLVAAGVAGCALPARRAVRVDPVEALRHE